MSIAAKPDIRVCATCRHFARTDLVQIAGEPGGYCEHEGAGLRAKVYADGRAELGVAVSFGCLQHETAEAAE